MQVNPTLSREISLAVIAGYESRAILVVLIEHFALPVIGRLNFGELSQEEYTKLGGRGQKPLPLTDEQKNDAYQRIYDHCAQRLTSKVHDVVSAQLSERLKDSTDAELASKAAAIKGQGVDTQPHWDLLPLLLQDHYYSFRELAKRSCLGEQVIELHRELCPLVTTFQNVR